MVSAAVFKGGSQVAQLSADAVLHLGKRVYRLTPVFDNLGARLPDSRFLRRGGPQFFVVNASPTRDLKIRNADGTQDFATIPSQSVASILFVGSDPTNASSWVISIKSCVISASNSIVPTSFGFDLGPGILTDVNLRAEFLSRFPAASAVPVSLTVKVRPNTVIRSSAANIAALDTGSFPANSTLTLINQGTIQGIGGDGGVPNTTAVASKGGAGGNAIKLQLLTDLDNTEGLIFGGGGGGGALFDASSAVVSTYGFGGGGAGGIPGTGNPASGASFVPDSTLSNHIGRDASEFFPGFGAPGSSAPRMFSPTSGGMGGFPGMPGEDIGGLGGANSTAGIPGMAIEGAQYLNSIQAGVIQGATLNTSGQTATIYISTIASSFIVSELLKSIGWDGVTPFDVMIEIAAGATIFCPKRYRTDTLTAIGSRELLIEGAIDTGSMPSGSSVTINNNGAIYGYGGWGGRGRTTSLNPTNGHDGGAAIKIRTNTTVNNSGIIAGGGGGGGGAGGSGISNEGGAGGAGMGAPPIPPFWPEPSSVNLANGLLVDRDARKLDEATDYPTYSDGSSQDGRWRTTNSTAGQGTTGNNGLTGGAGGEHGVGGQDGAGIFSSPGGAGGAAGAAIEGTSYATINDSGSILGAQLP